LSTVDVIDQVSPGSGILAVRDRPDMVLAGADAYSVERLLLVGWKTNNKRQSNWAKGKGSTNPYKGDWSGHL
jgi:hypothetical protein